MKKTVDDIVPIENKQNAWDEMKVDTNRLINQMHNNPHSIKSMISWYDQQLSGVNAWSKEWHSGSRARILLPALSYIEKVAEDYGVKELISDSIYARRVSVIMPSIAQNPLQRG